MPTEGVPSPSQTPVALPVQPSQPASKVLSTGVTIGAAIDAGAKAMSSEADNRNADTMCHGESLPRFDSTLPRVEAHRGMWLSASGCVIRIDTVRGSNRAAFCADGARSCRSGALGGCRPLVPASIPGGAQALRVVGTEVFADRRGSVSTAKGNGTGAVCAEALRNVRPGARRTRTFARRAAAGRALASAHRHRPCAKRHSALPSAMSR